MNLVILVVLYQVPPQKSETIRSLSDCAAILKQHAHKIILRDNSPMPYTQEQKGELTALLQDLDYEYRHDGCNQSLSEIYNTIIAHDITEEQMLILWDDDSCFDSHYFQTLATATQRAPQCALFLPIIRQGQQIISPSRVVGFKGSYWKKEQHGHVSTRHNTAINSGMAIRATYLLRRFKGYDTHLKFYNTDNFFMWQYGKTNSFFYVLPCTVHHHLDFYNPTASFSSAKARYREMRTSAIYLAGLKSSFLRILTYIYYDLFSIKCALLRKDLRYLFLR